MANWQDSCFLLHKRPFKDHYSWVYLLTREHGLVTACVRERKQQKTGLNPLITFARYWCQGREQQILKLQQIELEAKAINLTGMAAISGLYVNELIYKTCKSSSAPVIFQAYAELLPELALGGEQLLIALRKFELLLLQELGYGLDFSEVGAQPHYYYHNQSGLVATSAATKFSFSAEHLLAIANNNWSLPGVLSTARRLTKQVFVQVLDGKVLQTHAWFSE